MTDLKHGKCILCGSSDLQPLFAIEHSLLVSCYTCGLQFLSPPPDQKTLDKLYNDYYSAWGITHAAEEVSAMKKRTFQSFLKRISLPAQRGTFLDVGCATGEMLILAREMGYDVYGVEVSPQGKQLCRELFGEQNIIGKNLENDDFPADYFDIITLSDVIEHLPDPPAFLGVLEKILKPHGVLLIVTPDTSSWTRQLLGKYWPHYKPEHIFYFNRANLAEMCSIRFDLLYVEHAYKYLTLNYLSSIMSSYHHNNLIQSGVRLIQKLPEHWRTHPFRLHIGEMFMLLQKRA